MIRSSDQEAEKQAAQLAVRESVLFFCITVAAVRAGIYKFLQ